MSVLTCNEADFNSVVMESKCPVLVDFYAYWCDPCKYMSKILEKLSDDFSGKIKFVKLNVDECPNLANGLHIRSIPNLMLIENKKMKENLVGAISENSLVDILNKHI